MSNLVKAGDFWAYEPGTRHGSGVMVARYYGDADYGWCCQFVDTVTHKVVGVGETWDEALCDAADGGFVDYIGRMYK